MIRNVGRLLCVAALGLAPPQALPEPLYEYRFNLGWTQHVVHSQQEVEQILQDAGKEYAVMTVAEVIEINEQVTLLKYRAPPINPQPGYAYHYYSSRLNDSEGLLPSLAEAEAEMQAKLAAAGYYVPTARYSGTRSDGTPYIAYVMPNFPIASNLITDSANTPVSCRQYFGRGEISYGSDTKLYTQSSSVKHGEACDVVDDKVLLLTSTRVENIAIRAGYLCPAGYGTWWVPFADWCKNYRQVDVYRKQLVTCPVEPLVPLETLIAQYHANDSELAQLTRNLEAGANLSPRDLLTEATRQAESCVSAKFTADNFPYELTSTGRPKAYQAHFHDLYRRWLDHGKVDEDSPEWEACAERREQVELEVGKRVKTKGKVWDAPGGRFHQIVRAASAEGSKHPDGRAFDVGGVGKIEAYLAKNGPPAETVQDWVNRPTDCNVGWGGLFIKPDNVHFYLRQGEQQMEFIALIAALTAGMPELPPELHHGEPQWTRLLVSGEHVGDEVVYHYTIVNQHPDEKLIHLTLGVYYEEGGAVPDLVEKPADTEIIIEPDPQQPGLNRFWADMPESAWSAPPHWSMDFVTLETYPRFYLEFWMQSASAHAGVGEIPPGQQLDGFSIRLPKADPTYYETGFEAAYYYPSKNYFGYPEKLDVQAPQLTLTALKHNNVWPPNNKMVEVSVDVQVSDDYDSQPLVKLVSITANEPWDARDIEDADFGQDDRSFKLRASRSGSSPESRVYTITYSAEDAFGHVTERSVTVTIPHDRR